MKSPPASPRPPPLAVVFFVVEWTDWPTGPRQECDLLKIEDILPFFPDFVVIDSFKREICVSLEEYNGKIEGLRKEMEDYTLSSEAVQVCDSPV